MLIKGKANKDFNIETSKTDRDEVTFEDCRNCNVKITFKMDESVNESTADSEHRIPLQKFVFINCENVTVIDEFSYKTHYSLVDCHGCRLKLTSGNECIDLVACESISVLAIMLNSIHVFKSKKITVQCNKHCEFVGAQNLAVEIQRKWDVKRVMNEDRFDELVREVEAAP
eukprot:TRINITY_DN10171_c0_g1_i1.p1 TRINITY_DN10171_c0_g1~~TRINITY_DN10171_c0_g1_i1.p1  ORF type:complete len:171 (-),score=17.72 TRINITY_DN10171_c0_g1_i1:215-727(-)